MSNFSNTPSTNYHLPTASDAPKLCKAIESFKMPRTTIDEHGQIRDHRDEWRSGRPVYLEPLLDWPTTPKRIFSWLFGIPGFFFPWFMVFMVIVAVSYFFFTPDITRMQSFHISWMLEITARNLVLIFICTGGLHLWLNRWKKQGRLKKYNGNWPATNKKVFLFNDQVKDNVFWSVSGTVFWSLYECGLWWCYANDMLPYISFDTNPAWFLLWMFLIPIWRNFHFYLIHRLIHWGPLYKHVHYLHHKNVNVGPWSGMAMHPVEHILYFSCMLIHLIVPSHPAHMMFNGIQTGLGPGLSHSGFDEIMLGDEMALKNDRYLHYLHHKYHTVNFGESNVPMDKWFGSLHDGTPEADARFRAARKKA